MLFLPSYKWIKVTSNSDSWCCNSLQCSSCGPYCCSLCFVTWCKTYCLYLFIDHICGSLYFQFSEKYLCSCQFTDCHFASDHMFNQCRSSLTFVVAFIFGSHISLIMLASVSATCRYESKVCLVSMVFLTVYFSSVSVCLEENWNRPTWNNLMSVKNHESLTPSHEN